MEQPIQYELLLQAAACLERARQAEERGDLDKGKALRAEAQERLERSRKMSCQVAVRPPSIFGGRGNNVTNRSASARSPSSDKAPSAVRVSSG